MYPSRATEAISWKAVLKRNCGDGEHRNTAKKRRFAMTAQSNKGFEPDPKRLFNNSVFLQLR